MKLERSKGTKDFLPEEQIQRDKIISTLKKNFELYGYCPMETPALERYDVLASKYAGGAEIMKEVFSLEDQGKRKLALRYDLTVPLARVIGLNPTMKMPFKRYQIGNVWRDGPIASARYRQFMQCDLDVLGCKEMAAEAELLTLAAKVFGELELDVRIRVNSRKILNSIIDKLGIKNPEEVIIAIDKLDKIKEEGVKKELADKGLGEQKIYELFSLISLEGTNEEKLELLKEKLGEKEGIKEIEKLLDLLQISGTEADFDPSLARGLSYYTGTIFEVFMQEGEINSAICAGGRYDNMIGSFIGGKDIPAVGISFGLDRIYDALCNKKSEAAIKTLTKVFIIPVQTFEESLKVAEKLRSAGIKTEIDLMDRGPSKNLKYANSMGIPFVIFIGEEELKQKKLKLKNMISGEEKNLTEDEIIIMIKK